MDRGESKWTVQCLCEVNSPRGTFEFMDRCIRTHFGRSAAHTLSLKTFYNFLVSKPIRKKVQDRYSSSISPWFCNFVFSKFAAHVNISVVKVRERLLSCQISWICWGELKHLVRVRRRLWLIKTLTLTEVLQHKIRCTTSIHYPNLHSTSCVAKDHSCDGEMPNMNITLLIILQYQANITVGHSISLFI